MKNLDKISKNEINNLVEKKNISAEEKIDVVLDWGKMCNILYFIANTDILFVYMVLNCSDCNLQLFELIRYYDDDSIEKQYLKAKQFRNNEYEESVAKYKACVYLLFKKNEVEPCYTVKTLEDYSKQINLNKTALRILKNALQEFLDRTKMRETSGEDLAKFLFKALYKNMKRENWITKEELNKLLD